MKKLIAAIVLSLAASTFGQATTQPTAIDQIIDRVPETLVGDAIKSYDVIATIGSNQSPIIIRVRKTEAGKSSLYATCTKRHVPIFFSSDHEAFQYDPAMGVLRRFHNANVMVAVRNKDDKFTTDFNLHFQEKAATRPVDPIEPKIDLRSLMASTNENVTVKTVGEFQVITGHTRRGNPADFWIDAKSPFPLAGLALYIGEEPFFTFARIEINRPIDEKNMTMPSDQELSAILPIKEVDCIFKLAAWEAGVALSMTYEMAIEDPKQRPAVEAKLGKIDWEKRIAIDAEVNRQLIKLIGEQIPPDGLSKK